MLLMRPHIKFTIVRGFHSKQTVNLSPGLSEHSDREFRKLSSSPSSVST